MEMDKNKYHMIEPEEIKTLIAQMVKDGMAMALKAQADKTKVEMDKSKVRTQRRFGVSKKSIYVNLKPFIWFHWSFYYRKTCLFVGGYRAGKSLFCIDTAHVSTLINPILSLFWIDFIKKSDGGDFSSGG
jgi:hypothetical protein